MRSVGFGAAENLSHRLGSRKDDVAFGGSGLAAFCGRRQSRHQEFCTAGYAAAATPASVSQKRNTFLSHLDLWSGSNIDDETSELPEAMWSENLTGQNIISQHLLKSGTLCIALLKPHLGIFIPPWLECLRLGPSRRPYAMAPMPAQCLCPGPCRAQWSPCLVPILAACILPNHCRPDPSA